MHELQYGPKVISLWSYVRKLRLTKCVSKSSKTTISAETGTLPLLATRPPGQCPGLGSQSLSIYRSAGSEGGRKAIQV